METKESSAFTKSGTPVHRKRTSIKKILVYGICFLLFAYSVIIVYVSLRMNVLTLRRRLLDAQLARSMVFEDALHDFDYLPLRHVKDNVFISEINMTAEEYDKIEQSFYRYIRHQQYECRNQTRAVSRSSLGWDICLDPPFILVPGQCLVYTFRQSGFVQTGFEQYMTKKFNCKVLAFDPRLKMKKQYVKLQENVILYKTGLSAENKPSGNDQDAAWADNTWDLKTLGTILQSTAPSNAIIDYMKIDIQEGEWSALLTAFQEMSLQNVKQLCIEIHIVGKFSNFLTHERISALKTLRGIGFRIYSSEDLGRRKVSPYTGRNVHSRFRLYFINKHFLEQVRDMKRDNSSDTLW